jgi:4-amino-4-deoxy-L-arabinose transferase-like glycosyltransferase
VWALVGMLALACGLRVAALLSLVTTPYFDTLRLDEAVYHKWASQLASGTYEATSVYPAAPLPAYVVAVVYKVFSPNPLYIRILNLCLGIATCYVVYRIGWQLGNRRVGLVAGFVAALYKPFIFYSVVPMKTALSVFLFATTILCFLAVLRDPSRRKALSVGLVAGLLVNVRENAMVLIPVMLGMMLWAAYREHSLSATVGTLLLSFLIGLTIAAGPFALRNYLVSGELVLTTHQAGFNLYLGNNLDNPDPYYRPVPFASSSPSTQGIQFTIEASRRVGHTLSSAEASSYWIHEVVQSALTHPAAFLWKLGEKALALLNRFEAGDHYNIDFMSRFATFFQLPLPELALILPLGLAGMATAGFASRQAFGTTVASIAYALTLILFFTNDRYRLPLLTLLIPFAVIGLANLRASIRQVGVKSLVIYAGVVGLFVIVEYLPVRATDDVTAYYNSHAHLLDKKGFEQEAMAYWEQSSSMNKPFSAFAHLELANKYFVKEDFARVSAYLDKIPEGSFVAAKKYELVGDLLARQGQVADAVAAYERSLAINAGSRRPRSQLIRIFEGIDPDRAQRERQALSEIESFYQRP